MSSAVFPRLHLARSLLRIADELNRIEADCHSLQEADIAEALTSLSDEGVKRRQLLDRITQEIGGLSSFVEALARTGSEDAALTAVRLYSLQRRLAGADGLAECSGDELF